MVTSFGHFYCIYSQYIPHLGDLCGACIKLTTHFPLSTLLNWYSFPDSFTTFDKRSSGMYFGLNIM